MPADLLFSKAYDYCTTNWCIQNEAESAFTYRAGETFSDISKCNEPYKGDIEHRVANPPQNLVDICGDSIPCLVDGLCGDETDAANAIADEAWIRYLQDAFDPTPVRSCDSIFVCVHVYSYTQCMSCYTISPRSLHRTGRFSTLA